MEIRIGVAGRIIKGADQGAYVKVIDDSVSTGGFLVLVSTTPDMKGGFDDWVSDKAALERYFAEAAWVVDWLD